MRLLRVLAAATVLAFALPAYAYDLPAPGGPGDAEFRDICPPDSYMVGVKGRSGGWIDKIQLVCAPVRPDSIPGPRFDSPNAWGGDGGAPTAALCNGESYIKGMQPYLTKDDRQVRDLEFTCYAPLSGQFTFPGFFSQTTNTSNRSQNTYPYEPCSSGHLAYGIYGRYGKHVAAVGLICKKFVVPKPAAPPPPPPPPVAAAPVGPPPSFFGTWYTATDQGGEFDLEILPDAANVSGTFVDLHGNPQYNGTLRGTVNGFDLNFTFEQPAISGKGSGTFTIEPGGRKFTGRGRVDDTQQTPFVWTGEIRNSFSGVWDTATNTGGRFELVLSVSGYAVIGVFTNLDGAPQFNGTFLGDLSADKKSFTYRYTQKTGAHGGGRFTLSDDGQALTGTTSVDTDDTIYLWNGTRKK